ncbi:MAG: molybdopterin molybdotransferase MoeA [Opitutaceae bacterium]
MISVAEATRIIRESLAPLTLEMVRIDRAAGRFLGEAIHADRESPPFNRATMDGIAIRFSDWEAGRRTFPVAAIQAAGQPVVETPEAGACIEIMTGAPVAEGLDCVVRNEDIRIEDGQATLREGLVLESGRAIHLRGSDFEAGRLLVAAGTRLTGREIAVAASVGMEELQVHRSPKILVVTTGDELVDIDDDPKPHQIRRSNDRALAAALLAAGFGEVERVHLPDEPEMIRWQLERFLGAADAVVLTGGVSKGKFDYLPKLLEELGVPCLFHGVSQRPGKPMWYGVHKRPGDFLHPDDKSLVPIFALPGNPVSCFICLHRYVVPALRLMSGVASDPVRHAVLDGELSRPPALTWFLPVSRAAETDGFFRVSPKPFNTSGDFASLLGTDGFVELAADQTTFPGGSVVRFWEWL